MNKMLILRPHLSVWIRISEYRCIEFVFTDCQICLNRNVCSREMTWLFSVRMTGNFNFTLFNTYPLEYWNWKYTNVTYFYPWFGTVDDKSYISKQRYKTYTGINFTGVNYNVFNFKGFHFIMLLYRWHHKLSFNIVMYLPFNYSDRKEISHKDFNC